MIETYTASIEQLQQKQRMQRATLLWIAGTIALVIGSIMGAIPFISDKATPISILFSGIVLCILLSVPMLIWSKPRAGLMLLLAGGLLFPGTAGEGLYNLIPTLRVPFWINISTIGQSFGTNGLNPFVFSPAEVVMGLTALAWVIRGVSTRSLTIRKGVFFPAIAAYMLCVLYGFMHGISAGGDRTMALYEVRAHAHFLLVYLLAANLITERKHTTQMLWLIVGCLGLQGIMGLIGFLLHPLVSDQGILSHDDSLSLNLIIFIWILLAMTRENQVLRRVVFWLLPPVLVTVIENQRRAGIASFIIAFIPFCPMVWTIFPHRRAALRSFFVGFALISAVYFPIAWNSDGAWALPARAIRSQSSPSERDASSDMYREMETYDLKFTRDQSPMFGYGYGRQFLQPMPLIALTTEFLKYLPHNSVMWIWMRLGHVGFFFFLMMYAAILIRGVHILIDVNDIQLKIVGLLGILYLLMLFAFGKFDLQFVNSRQMAVTALLVGVLAVLRDIERKHLLDSGDRILDDSAIPQDEATSVSTVLDF